MSAKKQKTNLVAAKELPIGSEIRLDDGNTAYVFKQHNFYDENEQDVFETDCVIASLNVDEQRLFTIDGELKVEVINTESGIVFVSQLQDYDCILVQCDDVSVLCKVYDTYQGFIYRKARHQFSLKPKTGQIVDVDSLIKKKSFVKKMSHGFSCLMFQWNYFQRGRFFFHAEELKLFNEGGEEFIVLNDIVDSSLCRLETDQVKIIANQYLEGITSPNAEFRKESAKSFYYFVSNFVDNEISESIAIINECAKYSEIGLDIISYAHGANV